MVVSGYVEREAEIVTTFKKCITTKTTYHQAAVKPFRRLYENERLLNHAAALQLISSRTTIPVPKLLGVGTNADGTAWLETERTTGGLWLDVVRDKCRMPAGKRHTDDGECDECDAMARANAARFLADEVVPQLNMLTLDTTGLGGVVIPPLWVMHHHPAKHWPPQKAGEGERLVFCHGNLHGHSIMMHPETLHVMKIVDWDDAGFFPAAFQVWTVTRPEYDSYYEDMERLERMVALMEGGGEEGSQGGGPSGTKLSRL